MKRKKVREVAKSYYQRCEDEVKILIAEAKVKNNLTDETLSKRIGIKYNTFRALKPHPGKLRMDYIWAIERLAGRRRELNQNAE